MQEYLPPAKNSQQKVEALSCNIQYSRDCLVVQTEVKIKWWNKSLVFEVTFHCGQSRSYVFASFVWFQNKFPKNFHITSKTTFYNNHPHNSFLKKKTYLPQFLILFKKQKQALLWGTLILRPLYSKESGVWKNLSISCSLSCPLCLFVLDCCFFTPCASNTK